jgi:hypothetical protein
MNHKRKRPKSRRGGCLLCKPWKLTRNNKPRRTRTRHGRDVKCQELRANVSAQEQGA